MRAPVHSAPSFLTVGASYIILTTVQTLYSYFIEGKTIFVGKRKTFSNRVCGMAISLTRRLTTLSREFPNELILAPQQYQRPPKKLKPQHPRPTHPSITSPFTMFVQRTGAKLCWPGVGCVVPFPSAHGSTQKAFWTRRRLSGGSGSRSSRPWMENSHSVVRGLDGSDFFCS